MDKSVNEEWPNKGIDLFIRIHVINSNEGTTWLIFYAFSSDTKELVYYYDGH